MSGHVRVGGVWKTANAVGIKVGGAWKNVNTGYIKVAGTWKIWFSSGLASFSDNFNRTESPIAVSSSGGLWTALRGLWAANGTVATSADSATTYPLSYTDMTSANVTVNIDTPQTTAGGAGIAFWVSDANSWWAAFPYYSYSTTQVCNSGLVSCTSSSSSSCSGTCCGSVNSLTTYSCNAGDTLSGTTCTAPPTVETNYGLSSSDGAACVGSCDGGSYSTANGGTCTCPGYTYTAASSTTYSCYTSYTTGSATYTSNIRIVSSVSGTVTTKSTTSVGSSSSSYPSIASMRVVTSSGTITVSAYSGAGQTTQRGSSVVLTPTSPVTATGIGIIKAPGGTTQATNLDNISATAV